MSADFHTFPTLPQLRDAPSDPGSSALRVRGVCGRARCCRVGYTSPGLKLDSPEPSLVCPQKPGGAPRPGGAAMGRSEY